MSVEDLSGIAANLRRVYRLSTTKEPLAGRITLEETDELKKQKEHSVVGFASAVLSMIQEPNVADLLIRKAGDPRARSLELFDFRLPYGNDFNMIAFRVVLGDEHSPPNVQHVVYDGFVNELGRRSNSIRTDYSKRIPSLVKNWEDRNLHKIRETFDKIYPQRTDNRREFPF